MCLLLLRGYLGLFFKSLLLLFFYLISKNSFSLFLSGLLDPGQAVKLRLNVRKIKIKWHETRVITAGRAVPTGESGHQTTVHIQSITSCTDPASWPITCFSFTFMSARPSASGHGSV